MSVKRMNRLLGTGALFGATFSYGWFGVLARIVGLELPLFYQAAIRSLVTSLVFLVIIFFGASWKKLSMKIWMWATVRSFFGLIALIAFFVSVNFLPIGTVYFIFYAGSTIGGYIIGTILFREKLDRVKWLSLFFALAGLALIYSLNLAGGYYYLLLSLTAGLSTALWNTLHRKLPENLSPAQISLMDNGLLIVLAIPISVYLKESWVLPGLTTDWLANFALGILQIITGLLVVVGFRNIEVQLGSLVMLSEVLFGIIMGLLIYQEVISTYTLLGGVLILIGIALPEMYALQKSKK